jgi:hypothetical protein
VTSAHYPHRVQVWTINDGSPHPTGFWAISEIGVDRVMFSADYPYNARRLFRSDRDA